MPEAMSETDLETMQRSNVDALRPVYEEWGRGNWTPRFEVYASDMEWGWSEEFPGLAGVHRDPALRSSRLREWLSPWEDWRCQAEEFVTNGEFVVVLARYIGRGKESGVTVDTEGAHLWRMRDGRAIRLEVFSSRSRALAAAGLRG
jgi:ketosteroid isomerase-like protein